MKATDIVVTPEGKQGPSTSTATQETESWEARRERENAERRKRYLDLYVGVAEHLKDWTVKDTSDDSFCYRFRLQRLNSPKQISLDFKRGDSGKVHVSGYWPVNETRWTSPSDVREDSPSIGVSLSRGYEAIAREIERRFMPEYDRIYSKIEEKIATDNAYQNRKGDAWKRIIASGGVTDPRHQNGGDPTASVRIGSKVNGSYNYNRGYGDIRLTGENSVQIELRSLPVETALRVLEALKGAK